MSKSEYLKEWKKNKKDSDPDYFKEAGKKAYEKRKKLLTDNPELADKANKRCCELRKKARKVDPRKQLLADARKRAKSRGLEFNICVDDIALPTFCPVLGYKLEVGDGKRQDNSPSIDRINNSLGYIKGNVRIISFRANALKNNGTIEEFEKIIAYMKENLCHGTELTNEVGNE